MHPVIYHRMYHGNSPFVRVNKGLAGVTPSMLALSHTPTEFEQISRLRRRLDCARIQNKFLKFPLPPSPPSPRLRVHAHPLHIPARPTNSHSAFTLFIPGAARSVLRRAAPPAPDIAHAACSGETLRSPIGARTSMGARSKLSGTVATWWFAIREAQSLTHPPAL